MANRARLKNPERYRELERARQRKARAGLRAFVNEIKSSVGCSQCTETHPACLQFHHTNPENKKFAINRGVVLKMPVEAIKEEMKKCVILCANCHAKHHWANS
jgi:hypothetical protein